MSVHDFADDELSRLEKRIKKEYRKAYQRCYDEMQKVITKIQADDGTMDRRKMLGLLAKKRKLENLCKQMADQIAHAGKVAESLINSSVAAVYANTYNAYAGVLEFSLVTNQDVIGILAGNVNPFDHLALSALQDSAVIKRRMESEMVTSLLRGESIPKIARRLQNAAEGCLSNAVRVARTEVTRIESSAANDIGKHGEELGFDMGNRWIATKDKRTRHSHRLADHTEVRVGEYFEIDSPDGPDLMRFPGDVSMGAGADNVCNCRCRVLPFIIGIKSTALKNESTAEVASLNSALSVQ